MKRIFYLAALSLAVLGCSPSSSADPSDPTQTDPQEEPAAKPKAMVVSARVDGKRVSGGGSVGDISLTPEIAIEFTRAVKADGESLSFVSFTGGELTVRPKEDDATVLLFTPVEALQPLKQYRFTLAQGEYFGVAVQKAFTLYFTTKDDGSQKFPTISDEELLELSTPIDYSDIRFETEVYRSGKHHVKKTRDKANPWARRIGRHEGAQFYTIGQRKGLGIGGHAEPVFVLATDIARNIIYVGEGEGHKGLYRSCLRVAPDEIHWIRPAEAMQVGENRRYRVRIRYRQPLQGATLLRRETGLFILFDAPQRGISPGQFAVWYDGQEMVGSGVIA